MPEPEPDKSNTVSPAEALLAATRRFTRASFSRSHVIANGQLSHAEWHLLWILKHWPDPKGARPSELARRQRVTAGNVAQQLGNLAEQQLIVRQKDLADRRVVLVKLSTQGKKRLKQVHKEFVQDFERLIEHMGPGKSSQLIRLLLSATEFLENTETST